METQTKASRAKGPPLRLAWFEGVPDPASRLASVGIVMSQVKEVKGWSTNELFSSGPERSFLWEMGTPFGLDFGLFHFANLLHAQKRYTTQ